MAKERRTQLRVPVQLWVEESHETARYFQHCSNLSEGGIFIEKTIPHPIGTFVDIEFTLPGDEAPIRVRAEIVSALEDEEALGMGMKFVDLASDAAGRIRRFIADRAG
jgi:uncharacterized protein (TIGR02266 family)